MKRIFLILTSVLAEILIKKVGEPLFCDFNMATDEDKFCSIYGAFTKIDEPVFY